MMKSYVMAEKTKIGIYDQANFAPIQSWSIPTKNSGNSDKIEILYMTISQDEEKIGVALGKFIIKDLFEITEIAIYKQNSQGKFELEKLRDFEFKDACIQFEFNNKNSKELIFFTKEEVFKWDYIDESKEKEQLYKFDNELEANPKFGVFNSDQTKFIITSNEDILFVNITK